jgi:serine protease Do/serine protease DegQ
MDILEMKENLMVRLFTIVGLLLSHVAVAGLPVAINGQALPSLAPILDISMPAVVNIATLKNIQVTQNPLLRDPFFRHFYQLPKKQLKRRNNSLGSGVIVDKDKGLVLTNNHVIDMADEILVTLNDGRQFQAQLIGKDPEADIAVIQIPADNLTELAIADSTNLQVGDFVVAIGNPFGLGQTVTSGIISALGRTGLGIEGYEDFIQTDASINPGNSGGALINLRGELIGINTAILAPSGGNVGIGFAIPSNMVMTLMASLVEHGEVKRGLLGVTTQDLTPELVKAFELKTNHGAAISRVQSGSSADIAGLEPGDIIISIDGRKIKSSHEIRNIIGLLQIGDQVDIEILRGTKNLSVRAKIGKPENVFLLGQKIHDGLSGTVLSTSSKDQVEGVLISKVKSSSHVWRAGLRPGDIITSANRYRVRSLQELQKVANPQGSLLINIQRGRDAFFLVLN